MSVFKLKSVVIFVKIIFACFAFQVLKKLKGKEVKRQEVINGTTAIFVFA